MNDSHLADQTGLSVTDAAVVCHRILDRMEEVVVGKRQALEMVLAGLIAGGHVLIEDMPGLGKTLVARTLAQVTELSSGRIQFTPDLMPADVTGSLLFDQRTNDFHFRPGPVFRNIVLGDEINRAPPKTQAALLEAMQERQVTVDGASHPLPRPFLVIATQNPIEFEGTYPLPEAQLDRFLLKTSLGYPDATEEAEIIRRRLRRGHDDTSVEAVASAETVRAIQATLETIDVDDDVVDYAVALVHATRTHPQLQAGASPRGVDALVKVARTAAMLERRDYVTPDDVKRAAPVTLGHRVVLKPELWIRGTEPEAVVAECLASVPTPPTRPGAPYAEQPEQPERPEP